MAGPLPGGHIVRPLGLMGPLPSGLTFPQQSPSHVFRVFGVSVTNRTEKRPQRKKAKESGTALRMEHFLDLIPWWRMGMAAPPARRADH